MQAIEPITVTSGGQSYPDDDQLRKAVAQVTDKAVYVDGERIAGELGNPRRPTSSCSARSRRLSRQEGLAPGLTSDAWLAVIVAARAGKVSRAEPPGVYGGAGSRAPASPLAIASENSGTWFRPEPGACFFV